MKSMEAQMGKLDGRLKHWGARLDEVLGTAEAMGKEIKDEYRDGVATIKTQYQEVKNKLGEARAASAESWHEIKTGVEHAIGELEQAFKKLKTHDGSAK